MKHFYILLTFLLISIALLIAVSIYFCMIKYKSKQKTFIATLRHKQKIKRTFINMESNDELKEIIIKNCTCYYFDDLIKIEDFNLHTLTLKQLGGSSKESVKLWFFVTFNIILKHILPENFIEFPQVVQKI